MTRLPRSPGSTLVLRLNQETVHDFILLSSRNLHLQYLAKNQSTQHCQSFITQGSDHPLVLEPHMVLNYFTVFLPQRDYWRVRQLATTPRWDSALKDRDNEYSSTEVFLHSYLNKFITNVFVQLLLRANYYRTTGD
jgi:hypothetical protein